MFSKIFLLLFEHWINYIILDDPSELRYLYSPYRLPKAIAVVLGFVEPVPPLVAVQLFINLTIRSHLTVSHFFYFVHFRSENCFVDLILAIISLIFKIDFPHLVGSNHSLNLTLNHCNI